MQTGLISQALVIGSVEAAVYWTDEGLCALRQDASGGFVDCSRQASLLLDCPAERRLLVDVSREQLEQSITLWSRRQRLLNWLIIGMDGTLSDETRRLSLGLAETAWIEEIAAFARARLLGCPLPSDADTADAIRLANGLPHCLGMFHDLMAAAEYIEPVSRKLKELVYFDYAGDAPPDETYRALLDRGLVEDAVMCMTEGDVGVLPFSYSMLKLDSELLNICPFMPDLLEAFHDWISEKYGQKIRNAPIKNYVQAPKGFIGAKVDVDSVPHKPTILMDSPLYFKDTKVQVRKLRFPLRLIKQFSLADKIPQPKQSENTSQAALINAARRRFHSWGQRQSKKATNERLINAAHCFADISHKDPRKLFYLLYMLDIRHFRERGESCTGETYYAKADGPAPGMLRPLLFMGHLDMHAAIGVLTATDSVGPWHFDTREFSPYALEVLYDLVHIYREVGSLDFSLDDNKAWLQVYDEGKGLDEIIPLEMTIGRNPLTGEFVNPIKPQAKDLNKNGVIDGKPSNFPYRHKPK